MFHLTFMLESRFALSNSGRGASGPLIHATDNQCKQLTAHDEANWHPLWHILTLKTLRTLKKAS